MTFGYYSLLISLLAGLAFAAALQHGFNAWRTRDRVDGAYFVTCITLAASLLLTLGYNNAWDVDSYRRFYQAHALVSRPFFILWAWIVLRFSGFRSPWPYRLWIGAEAVKALLLLAFIRTPYFFDIQGVGHRMQPWGEAIAYPVGRGTPLQFIMVLLPLVMLGFSAAGVVRLARHRRPAHAAILAAMTLFTTTVILWDNLADFLGWPDIDVTEFVIVAPILFLGWMASKRLTEAEDRTRELNEARLEARRLEALGNVAGAMAHEFNNLLMAVGSQLELAASGPVQEREEALGLARRALGRGREIIRRILKFARRDPGAEEPRPVDAAAAVGEALQLLKPMLAGSIRLDLDDQARGLVLLAAPGPLQQILLNLGLNAGQALGRGPGRIRYGLARRRVELDEPGGPLPGDYGEIRVSDDGPGMPPEVRERIFEPFFTTKGLREGSGLGLSVVHGLVAGMGGTVSCQSEAGRGTTFTVLLPATDAAPVEAPRPTPAAPTPGRTRGEILVLDDEGLIADALAKMLRARGHAATAMDDARKALRLLEDEPGRFRLLITDMNMPDLDGEAVLREARRIDPGLKVILSTGSLGLGGGHAGFDGLAEKPYAIGQLESLIRALDGGS